MSNKVKGVHQEPSCSSLLDGSLAKRIKIALSIHSWFNIQLVRILKIETSLPFIRVALLFFKTT